MATAGATRHGSDTSVLSVGLLSGVFLLFALFVAARAVEPLMEIHALMVLALGGSLLVGPRHVGRHGARRSRLRPDGL